MIEQQRRAFVDRLIGRTKAGGLEWAPTAEDEVFSTWVGDQLQVLLIYRPEPHGNYTLSLLDRTGTLLDTITEADGDIWASHDEGRQVLADLHAAARRRTERAAKAYEAALQVLGADAAVPTQR